MVKNRTPVRSQPNIPVLLSALILFLLTAWEAHFHPWGQAERSLFFAIYNLPLWLRPVVLVVTQTGSSWMVAVMACGFLALKKGIAALHVITVGLSAFLLTELAKVVIARPRPFDSLPNVQAREPFVSGMGFPSGHTTVTTAVALVVFWYIPAKWRPILPVWILLVGFSRIYLGVHAPLDVVGGLALGTFVAEGFWLLWPKLGAQLHIK